MSLLHKPTREACGAKLDACKNKVRLYRANPGMFTECVKEKWTKPKTDRFHIGRFKLLKSTDERTERDDAKSDRFDRGNEGSLHS